MGALYIHGIGHFHPNNVIDNAFLEALDIGTNDQWIVDRVGIEERRTVLPLDYIRTTKNQRLEAAVEAAEFSNAECGRRASLMALERAGISPSDVGMVIAGGCAPDTLIPAEAAMVAEQLGIEAVAFDVGAACSSFAAICHVVASMGQAAADYVLVVTPENMTRVTNYADRATAVLFGDATAAAVLSTKHPARARVVSTSLGGAPSGAQEVVIPRLGFFQQDGPKVHKFAIKRMSSLLSEIIDAVGESRAERVHYIGHQANLTMLRAVTKRCQIPTERHFYNIVKYGNQGAAGAPSVWSQRWGQFAEGDVLGIAVVGSGLTWGSMRVEFS